MKNCALFILLCLGLFGCVSTSRPVNEIGENTAHNNLKDKANMWNPYNFYNLQKTRKIEIQMISSLETEPRAYSSVPQEKTLLSDEEQKIILKELNKDIESNDDFCLCDGSGNIIFTLNDGSTIEFRVKHCGSILESIFVDDTRNFQLSQIIENILRKYYSEAGRYHCEIEDRLKSGQITEEQLSKEYDEYDKLYHHAMWVFTNDDLSIKDSYYKETIVGPWEIETEYNGETFYAMDAFSVDGEVWHRGDIKTASEIISGVEMKCSWEIKDGILKIKPKAIRFQKTPPKDIVIKYKIYYMSDRFIQLRDENDNMLTYKKLQ